MSVESTIASLLEESKKLKGLAEANEVVPTKGTPEPSNDKNNVDDEPEAKGGTSKKANRVTDGAVAPEGMEKLKAESEEIKGDEISEDKVDMSADVEALFNGEEGLTEEFRQKAETIFEAAVTSRIKEEVAIIESALQEQFELKLQEAIDAEIEGLVENVNGYLNLMVEQWMENNAVALESGMKSDILESFVGGLKGLFEEHYIDVPEEKFDLVGDLESKIEELSSKLNESVATNVGLKQALNESVRDDIVKNTCSGLSDLEAEKLQSLSEEISFEDADSFATKMQTIRENYFAKKSVKSDVPSILTEETIQEEKVVTAEMAAYVKTLSTLAR